MKNLMLQVFLHLCFLSLCFHHAISSNITQGAQDYQGRGSVTVVNNKTCSLPGENGRLTNGSPEFENETLRNIRDNFQTGIIELLKVINSLNKSLAAQKEAISALKEENKLIRKLNNLKSKLSWKDFDELILTQNTKIQIGGSFNGSTLMDIKSRVSQLDNYGCYTLLVLVNHLDEAIQDFTIYDYYNHTYSPALKSIPPHTKEIFPLAGPSNLIQTSFSYVISSINMRVAAVSYTGTRGVGLSFVPRDTDMKTYFQTRYWIDGWECCEEVDKNLTAGYKNVFARMLADHEGVFKATLVIEVIQLAI